MKKILVIGPSPTRSQGGIATVIQGIQNDIHMQDHYKIEIYESYISGGKISRFPYMIWAFLKFELTKRDYDLYHIHVAAKGSLIRKGWYVNAAKRWGKKVILHVHGSEFLKFYNESGDRMKQQMTDILNRADMVIALSDEWKHQLEEYFHLQNCVVVENGINTQVFEKARNSDAPMNSFLMLGRQGHRKGSYDLVKAVAIVAQKTSDLKLYMAGDGEVERVRNLVEQEGMQNQIDVIGWIGFQDKIQYLQKTATLILPSYNEGLPMAILEAMAAGKAIISTKVGAIPEVIGPENGILVEPGDIKGIAEAMIRISNDKELYEKMKNHNIRKVESQYSIQIMHEKLIHDYDILLNEK